MGMAATDTVQNSELVLITMKITGIDKVIVWNTNYVILYKRLSERKLCPPQKLKVKAIPGYPDMLLLAASPVCSSMTFIDINSWSEINPSTLVGTPQDFHLP